MKSTLRTMAAASAVGIGALTLTSCIDVKYQAPTAQMLPKSFPVHFENSKTYTPACAALVEQYSDSTPETECGQLNLYDRDGDGTVDATDAFPTLYAQKQASNDPRLKPAMTDKVQAAVDKLHRAHIAAIAAWPKHLHVMTGAHIIDADQDGKFDTFGGFSGICTAEFQAKKGTYCDPKKVVPKEAMPALNAYFDAHREAALEAGLQLYETKLRTTTYRK